MQQVLQELPRRENQQHKILIGDFSNPDEIKDVITEHMKNHQGYHILVNNTGGPAGGPIQKAAVHEFEHAFQQHLLCNHVLVQALLDGMKKANYGRIINIISTSVKQPLDGLGVSNTIRAAVANWSKTMANELGQYGITVNNVLPGATATERLHEIVQNKAKKTSSSTQQAEERMKASIPAGRFAKPEEIAAAVTFLASNQAAYINGINLPVDGGRTKSL
ncbi:SDR family oxidoreductase [Gangjinia marincola]|uniref:SDR family oxidoreductase n=1 Tax=Gangjinia marincola TaxID=578463 RepID=A0ABN1MJD5_9FLAO